MMPITTNEELGAYVGELLSIDEKLTELKARIVAYRKSVAFEMEPLQKRSDELEKNILVFLQNNGLPGVQRAGKKVFVHKQTLPVQRENRIKKVLEECKTKPNVSVEDMTGQILTALKQRSPSEETKTVLKIFKE